MNERLQADLKLSGSKAQYDANAKRLLSHKIILAHILVSVAPEFCSLTPEEAIPLIEGEPQISEVPVNPGETNAAHAVLPVITGTGTESKIPNEGTITYDIRFHVWTPGRKHRIKIIVDMEAQKDLPHRYDIVTRGIFYNARQISAQLGTEFNIPEYDNIKKVYSIWVCMNVPKHLENTAMEYPIRPNTLVGNVKYFGRYDLANVVIINLSKELAQETDELRLHRLLETLLFPNLTPAKKTAILTEEYNVVMTEDLERSINIMCNLSEAILEEGLEKGLEKGRFMQLNDLIKDGTLSLEQAASKIGVTSDEFTKRLKEYEIMK